MANSKHGPDHEPRPTTAGHAGAGARTTSEEVADQAKATASKLKQQAQEAAEHTKAHARSLASEQKDAAAKQMDGFAQALRAASVDLDGRGQDFAAAYVRQAAGGLERASGAIRDRDLDGVIESVESFARRQPVAFLGGAVAAGFGLARLMKSSAERRRSTAAGYRTGGGAA